MHTKVIHLLMICHKPNGDHLRLIRHRLETPRVMYLSTSDMFRTWFGYPNLAGSDFPNLVRTISPKMQTEVTPRSPTQHNLSQTKWLPFTDEQTQLGGFRSDISQIMMKYWYKSIKNGGFSRFSTPRWWGDQISLYKRKYFSRSFALSHIKIGARSSDLSQKTDGFFGTKKKHLERYCSHPFKGG